MPEVPITFELPPINNNIENENISEPEDNIAHNVVQAMLDLATEEV